MVKGRNSVSSSGKANKPKNKQTYRKTSWDQCQCSGSSQIPSQDSLDSYHQFLSLYKINRSKGRTELHIYDTENKELKVKNLYTDLITESTCITQLPNGELFCYGNWSYGMTLIIDRSYGFRMLPSGTSCYYSSALYFDNNIYCFGGCNLYKQFALSRKFDLKKNKWINLSSLPKSDACCHSVIYNGNILVSGYFCENLWLYSVEIDSLSTIPYHFAKNSRKFMINVKNLYLIEWCLNGSIYEGEDEYHWKRISVLGVLLPQGFYQIYCLYNKENIYISTKGNYLFDLKQKVLVHI